MIKKIKLKRTNKLSGMVVIMIYILLSGQINMADAQQKYAELYRPQYHFSPEKNWMNDVNGLVYMDGEYHMFYQYNPFGDLWGHMSWGHAVSKDMLHWEHLPIALPEENGIMIFSGSAVVDKDNTSGFGSEGRIPLVAIYTGRRNEDDRQYQCLAYSLDKGRTWVKYEKNPVIDINSNNFRDPYVFWHKETSKWVMVVSLAAERKVRFYSSANLKEWILTGEFGPYGAVEGIWECPTMFPINIEGTSEIKWILQIDISAAVAGGSGGQYFIGDFDGNKFSVNEKLFQDAIAEEKDFFSGNKTEPALWIDFGPDHYAVIAWSGIPASDGRTIWCAWMDNWRYADVLPTSPWRGMATFPRELSLKKSDNVLRLFQQPIKEIESLRGEQISFIDLNIEQLNKKLEENKIAGNTLEIEIEADVSKSGFSLELLKGEGEQTVIKYDNNKQVLVFDRSKSGRTDFHKDFSKSFEAPLKINNNAIKLHILIDHNSVEIFANDGEKVMTGLVFPGNKENKINISGFNDGLKIKTFNAWKLKSVWN